MSSKVAQIRNGRGRGGSKFHVLFHREVDGELKFMAESNKTARDICAGDGSTVPCIEE